MIKEVLIWVLVLVLEASLVSIFLNTDWIREQIYEERQNTLAWMGEEATLEIVNRTDRTFRFLFIDSGILEFTYDIFVPDKKEHYTETELTGLSQYVEVFADRLDAIWSSVYQAVQRFALISEWMPFMLMFVIPCFFDGLGLREVKKLNYGYSSPVRYHTAVHGLMAMVFLPIVYMFFPIAIPPQIVPWWMFFAGGFALLFAANIQKLI
jgi:hypothetical protein